MNLKGEFYDYIIWVVVGVATLVILIVVFRKLLWGGG